jgi:hypothetical protein
VLFKTFGILMILGLALVPLAIAGGVIAALVAKGGAR